MIPQSAAVCPGRMPVCAASSVPITTRARSLLMRRRSVRSLRKSRTVPAISPTSSPSFGSERPDLPLFSSHFPPVSSAPLPFPLFFFFRWRGLRVQRNANRPIPCLHAHLAGHADGFNACQMFSSTSTITNASSTIPKNRMPDTRVKPFS